MTLYKKTLKDILLNISGLQTSFQVIVMIFKMKLFYSCIQIIMTHLHFCYAPFTKTIFLSIFNIINIITVNLCALDISKAFDRMNHHGLFVKLLDRRIPTNLYIFISPFRQKKRNIQANKQREIEKKHKSNTYLTVNRLMLMLLRTTTHLKLHICHY